MDSATIERLSLDDFLLEAERSGVARAPASTLAHLVERLELSPDVVESAMRFDPAGYTRTLLRRTAELDLLVLCWLPEQHSPIHDHAGSRGVVRVYSGVLTSRTFTAVGPHSRRLARLRRGGEAQVAAPGVAAVDLGGIHQLANLTSTNLVTVHVYSPPLTVMNAYDAAPDTPSRS